MQRFNKHPKDMQSLLGAALARHNIGRQVTAALVVRAASKCLAQIVESAYKPDVKAHAFKHGTLTLACRHPAVIGYADTLKDQVKRSVEAEVPNITILNVEARFLASAWSEHDILRT